jgi:hypothetical protein
MKPTQVRVRACLYWASPSSSICSSLGHYPKVRATLAALKFLAPKVEGSNKDHSGIPTHL